ncbi:MAG TPA: bacillithiol system redox-active protein YtxJ [Bacteroidetes bacterium]|nr:bacillithiol system redox-active protein YtxJ [Bacteroidota bacterium]
MDWKLLADTQQIEQIVDLSHQVPCLIFKHSTRCSISSIAKYRLETNWPFSDKEIAPFFLDLIAHREVSHAVAEQLQVHHESPQIILLKNGEVVLDASHLDISIDEIKEVLALEKV